MKLVINIGLFLIARVLVAIFFPVALLFAIVRGIYKRRISDWYVSTSSYFFMMAYAIDKFGNVLMAPIFNTIVIKDPSQSLLFGNPNETISSCLGRNMMYRNLTLIGRLIQMTLDFIDEDHCAKAAEKFLWDE